MSVVDNRTVPVGRDLFGAQRQAAREVDLHHPSDRPQASTRHLTMHQDSSQLEDCLYPVRGIRDQQMRSGIKPVDFARQNRLALQKQSAENQQRRLSEGSAALSAQASRRSTPSISRRTSGTATPSLLLSHRSTMGTARSRSSSGGPSGPDAHGPKGDLAVYGPPKAAAKHSNYGQVPAYLRERQLEMAEDRARQQAEKEASLVPKGMRILPDAERAQIVEGLQASKRDVQQQIQELPLRVETLAQKRHQRSLEERMAELEEALALFSKPTVLVPCEPEEAPFS
ncbi:hypothetical protein WJX73_010850 [Symbiochloris irregularis]|uniref:Enkurin domain-containing protein n=1 Tax=Symbiochloris irregularis TaxID=706552 RepID=A0AAW1P805_9CHLO